MEPPLYDMEDFESQYMSNPIFTNWKPRPGWLILLPSRTSPKKGDLVLPDSVTKKNNSGVCIKAGHDIDKELFFNQECFFPTHSEFQIKDSDTGFIIYVVEAAKIILIRTPPPEVMRFSREKGEGLSFETLTHDQQKN
jgi:hypothetical protein